VALIIRTKTKTKWKSQKIELELIQIQMTQKPMLWAEGECARLAQMARAKNQKIKTKNNEKPSWLSGLELNRQLGANSKKKYSRLLP
jgi:hypothetical protein